MKILFFDTETTGTPKNYKAPMSDLDNWPRVIQLAWQVVDRNTCEPLKSFKFLIKPEGWVIPVEKFWIDNGYSTEQNEKEGFPMNDVLDAFIQDYNNCNHLVAHNINFDYNILGSEMIRYKKRADVKLNQICTMLSSVNTCKLPGQYGGYKWPKLEELHHILFNEGFDGAHDALADVSACRRSFFELVNRKVINI